MTSDSKNLPACPVCGASWQADVTCEEAFYQMLYWENEVPENGEVHHLMVLCYYIQHPHLYSPEGLTYSIGLLREFVINQANPAQVRRERRNQVDSAKRDWKVTGTSESHGAFPRRPAWTQTAPGVVSGGIERYRENTRAWARSVLEAIDKESRTQKAQST